MTRNPSVTGLLSLLVPGLGQIYSGRDERGASILIATIIVGNLNAIWLSLYAARERRSKAVWANQLPLFLHRLFATYGVMFWVWQVFDARRGAKGDR